MKAGAAHIDITPPVGAELSGFALRPQPATGVLDRLAARALWLEDGARRVLWLHADVIGFDAAIVAELRAWAGREPGLAENEVLLTATHTHSGPCTLRLSQAGTYDEAYAATLLARLKEIARLAMRRPEDCAVVSAAAPLELAVHRRGPATALTDPRAGALGLRRADGAFAAVIANAAIHPVALGPGNRLISGDLFGVAADELAGRLPGNPVVLLTNGACGNLNPPAVGVPPAQMLAWGRQIAAAIAPGLLAAPAQPDARLATAACRVPLALDVPTGAALDAEIARLVAAAAHTPAWQAKLRRAAAEWRAALDGAARERALEVFALALGDTIFAGVNAELFAHFAAWLRRDTGHNVLAVGYANGDVGYVAPRAAYAEGGYEVETAHVFYGVARFAPGGLERLAHETAALLRREFTPAAEPART